MQPLVGAPEDSGPAHPPFEEGLRVAVVPEVNRGGRIKRRNILGVSIWVGRYGAFGRGMVSDPSLPAWLD